jgi:hypothetical protein
MKQCPFCAGAIADDATLCKYCKQALPSPRVAAPPPGAAAAAPKKNSGFVWVGGMAAGACLVVGIVGLMAFRARPAKSGLDSRQTIVTQGLTAARTISEKK